MNTTHLIIVVPCYNEESVLPETIRQLSGVLNRMLENGKISIGKILFVDDGSKDKTWEIITEAGKTNGLVGGLKLAHNSGHQYALLAGLEWASTHCDAAISIDADLQDDVDAIEEMTDCFLQGADIVYGVRRERTTDTWFKKNTALLFYQLIRKMGSDVVYNHADFRLMSKRALQALVSYYPFKKMLSFALDGITSFSVKPLQLILTGGFIFGIIVPIIMIIYALVQHAHAHTIPGWTSLLVSIWFIGGMIMMAIGITGIYIGKIYKEVKQRPRYFIEEDVNLK